MIGHQQISASYQSTVLNLKNDFSHHWSRGNCCQR